jgi:formylglycine-generating enzyme required for sulfatase activity
MGLVPLGPDPESQLEEFAHLLSGEPAVRNEQKKLQILDPTGIVLVLIPGGRFRMGAQNRDEAQPNYDPMACDDEAPVRGVLLDPYLMAKHEMTQGQWLRIAGENPSADRPCSKGCPVTLHNPVENVTWEDCVKMLRRLGLVLPTEAQWERAARAGTGTPWHTGREESETATAGWLRPDHAAKSRHVPVGSYLANPFGLWDVIGNVKECCSDCYVSYEHAPRAGDGRREAPDAGHRVLRGGSMSDIAGDARSARRDYYEPTSPFGNVGCRPAGIVKG